MLSRASRENLTSLAAMVWILISSFGSHAGERGSAVRVLARASADHAEDVGFLHDQEVLAVELDLASGPFAEQDPVARLDVERSHRAVLGTRARADGDDFAFLRLLLGGVRDDDATRGLRGGEDAADEHAVVEGAERHGIYPRAGIATKTSLHKREPALPICDWHSHGESDNLTHVGVVWRQIKPRAGPNPRI